MSAASSTKPFDTQKEVMASFGFKKDYCFKCKKHNSELSGMLMQCGKCKKAYYCGMKCFNEDLEEHQKICNTEQYVNRDPERMTAEDFIGCVTPTPSVRSKISAAKIKDMNSSISSGISVTSKQSRKSKKATKSRKSTKNKKKKEKGKDGAKTSGGGGDGGVECDKKIKDELDQIEENNDKAQSDVDIEEKELMPSEIFLASDNPGHGESVSKFEASMNASWMSAGAGFNGSSTDLLGTVDEHGSSGNGSKDENARKRMGGSSRLNDSFCGSQNGSIRQPDQFSANSLSPKEEVSLNSATTEKREVGWKKPAWSSELGVLRKTKNGAKLREGADVTRPISAGVDSDE